MATGTLLNFVAVGFVSPGFALAGAALVAIPIIIHILNRRRFKVVSWAAMEFLLQAMRKNRRRLKFEQWVLLVTRCALLALLGLALARPLGCGDGSLAGALSQRTGMYVFVIDNSYSMAYDAPRPGAKTHLDQAKALAKQMVDKMVGGESVVIITSGTPAKAIIAKPSYNLAEIRNTIDHIEQSYGGTDLPGALQKALDVAREESKQPRKSLDIFTDSTKAAWEGSGRAQLLAALGPDLAKVYRITHHNLGLSNQSNDAVIEVKRPDTLVTTHFSADFSAVARGYGAPSAGSIVWKNDDALVPGAQASANLDLQTPPLTSPQINFAQGGPHVLSVAIAGSDPLPADNTRYRVVDVAAQLPVLIAQGDSGSAGGGSGDALAMALAPMRRVDPKNPSMKSNSAFAPELISDTDLAGKLLANYRAVALTNVPSFSAAQADALQKYVHDGGTLMIFMGSQVRREQYNDLLAPRGLMPGKLIRSIASEQTGFRFDFNVNGNMHRFLSVFRGNEKSGLDTARVYEYWQLELPKDSPAERVLDYLPADAAATAARDPAITYHSLGQGHVVWISTSSNNDWTALLAKPVYLELMHELLLGSVRTGDDWLNLSVGDSVRVPTTLGLTGVPSLSDSSKKEIAIDPVKGDDGQMVYQSHPLDKPGLYLLTAGTRSFPIAVNVPADESDIRTIPDAGVKKALADIDLALMGDTLPADVLSQTQSSDLGWSVMCIVLALAGLECLMAMKFGHYRRSVHPVPAAAA